MKGRMLLALSIFALLGILLTLGGVFKDGEEKSPEMQDVSLRAVPKVPEKAPSKHDGNSVGSVPTSALHTLTSEDDSVRRSALRQLLNEFRFPGKVESRFFKYGNDLLPVLDQVMNNPNDKYARYAVETVYHMSLAIYTRKQALEIAATSKQYTAAQIDGLLKSVEDLKDYPDAVAYPSMKDTLIGVLTKSPDPKARSIAAVTLGNGFGDETEIEGILARRFPVEKDSKARRGILRTIAVLGRKRGHILPASEAVTQQALGSDHPIVQEEAARIVRMYRFKGGLKALVQNLPSAPSQLAGMNEMLSAIVSYGDEARKFVPVLADMAAKTTDEKRKEKILSTIDAINDDET